MGDGRRLQAPRVLARHFAVILFRDTARTNRHDDTVSVMTAPDRWLAFKPSGGRAAGAVLCPHRRGENSSVNAARLPIWRVARFHQAYALQRGIEVTGATWRADSELLV